MEKYAARTGNLKKNDPLLYLLHKNIVLFHEHTWGAWCSVTDPDLYFTTEQWRIKKQFVDSAQYYYDQLADRLGFKYKEIKKNTTAPVPVNDFSINPATGSINRLLIGGINQVADNKEYGLFEPVYVLGLNPSQKHRPDRIGIREISDTKDQKIVEISGELTGCSGYTVTYTLQKNTGLLTAKYRLNKKMERNKESLHIAFPFSYTQPELEYGSPQNRLRYPQDQLAGSNKEFICVEKELTLRTGGIKAVLASPLFALWEVGGLIDETRVNGAKVWKRDQQPVSTLYLYVLNNYWHTNYKADQAGIIEFTVSLQFHRFR